MIRIRVALLDTDETYSSRLANAFNTYYQDKLEVYSFTDREMAISFLSSNKVDVFLVDENIDFDILKIPNSCAFAYLTVVNSAEVVNGQKAVCKFQKVDLIYKEILSLFSEVSAYSFSNGSDHKKSVVSFISFAGGTGASTLAAAYATRLARQGKKPIYLNLEYFGCANEFFDGEGNMGMSDIIYSLKSKKNNLILKIESAIKKSPSGVYFIDAANIVLDMLELKKEDIFTLIEEIKGMDDYDELVIDSNFNFTSVDLDLLRKSDVVVAVTDGSSIANSKTQRCINSIQLIEQQNDEKIVAKIKLFYNKFSSTSGKKLKELSVDTIGGAPYCRGTTRQIVENLCAIDELDKI